MPELYASTVSTASTLRPGRTLSVALSTDDAGAAAALDLQDAVYRQGGSRSGRLEQHRPTEVELSVLDTDTAVYDALAGYAAGDVQVRVTETSGGASVVLLDGYLHAKLPEPELGIGGGARREMELTAWDGLTLLKSVPYVGSGRAALVQVLAEMLAALPGRSLSSWDVYLAMEWRPAGMLAGATGRHLMVDRRVWVDASQTEVPEVTVPVPTGGSTYDALIALLSEYDLELSQVGGAWYAVQRSMRAGQSTVAAAMWSAFEGAVFNDDVDIDLDVALGAQSPPLNAPRPRRITEEATPSVQHRRRVPQTPVELDDWSAWTETTPPGWQRLGTVERVETGGIVRARFDDDADRLRRTTSIQMEAGDRVRVSLGLMFEMSPGEVLDNYAPRVARVELQSATGATLYQLATDGRWHLPTSAGGPGGWVHRDPEAIGTTVSLPAPVGGTIWIELMFESDSYEGVQSADGSYPASAVPRGSTDDILTQWVDSVRVQRIRPEPPDPLDEDAADDDGPLGAIETSAGRTAGTGTRRSSDRWTLDDGAETAGYAVPLVQTATGLLPVASWSAPSAASIYKLAAAGALSQLGASGQGVELRVLPSATGDGLSVLRTLVRGGSERLDVTYVERNLVRGPARVRAFAVSAFDGTIKVKTHEVRGAI